MPSESWAWTALGACKLFFRDHRRRGRRHAPRHRARSELGLAYGALALVHAFAGEPEAALDAVGAARRLSPSDPREAIWLNAEGIALFALGRYGEALEAARRMTELRPDYPTGHRLVAASAAVLGLDDVARAAVARLLELMPGHRLEHVPALMPFLDLSVAAPYFARSPRRAAWRHSRRRGGGIACRRLARNSENHVSPTVVLISRKGNDAADGARFSIPPTQRTTPPTIWSVRRGGGLIRPPAEWPGSRMNSGKGKGLREFVRCTLYAQRMHNAYAK